MSNVCASASVVGSQANMQTFSASLDWPAAVRVSKRALGQSQMRCHSSRRTVTSWSCLGLGHTQQVGMLTNKMKDTVLADALCMTLSLQ